MKTQKKFFVVGGFGVDLIKNIPLLKKKNFRKKKLKLKFGKKYFSYLSS